MAATPGAVVQLPPLCVSSTKEADPPQTHNSPKLLNKGKITGKTACSECWDFQTVPQPKSPSSVQINDKLGRVSDRGSLESGRQVHLDQIKNIC